MIEDAVARLSSAQQDTLRTALGQANSTLQNIEAFGLWDELEGEAPGSLVDTAEPEVLSGSESWRNLEMQAEDALRRSEPAEALDMFVQLVTHQPLHAPYVFGFALCLQQLGQIQEAVGYFSLAHALQPSDGACAFRMGECLWALGYTVEAQDALRAAIELDAVPEADPMVRELAQKLLDQIS